MNVRFNWLFSSRNKVNDFSIYTYKENKQISQVLFHKAISISLGNISNIHILADYVNLHAEKPKPIIGLMRF